MPTIKRRISRTELNARARSLLKNEISFIHSEEFQSLDETEIDREPTDLRVDEKADFKISKSHLPTHLSRLFQTPLLTPEGETYLFRRMNYLKYRANQIRSSIDPQHPRIAQIRAAEELLSQSLDARREIAESNLRLVASIARKLAKSMDQFEDFLAEGNAVLVYAIDKFDFSRGFRFSTYATHAVQRHLFRVLSRLHRRYSHEATTDDEILRNSVAAPDSEVNLEEEFPIDLRRRMMKELQLGLDKRERQILRSRFGLNATGSEMTFKTIAADLGLSKERVRQLQHRAISKLRELLGLSVEDINPS